MSLKAITSYMENYASLNGNGSFVLSVNGVAAQRIFFTSDNQQAIQFDIASIASSKNFNSMFTSGKTVQLSVALQNFTIDSGETEDFKVQYAFSFQYFDTQPIGTSKTLQYSVSSLNSTLLGKTTTTGKIIAYTYTLTNPSSAKGLGMTLAILRVPSCLQVNFNYLDQMVASKKIAYYEVRNANTEVVFYYRQMAPGASIV